MKKNRRKIYRKYWQQLLNTYGHNCYYCHIRAATTIDHIIPVNYCEVNDIDNLVPSCLICNVIASDKIFDDVYQKSAYIQKVTNRRYKNKIAECTGCLLLYQYRIDSPSLFLCPECYDYEYDENYGIKKGWRNWLELLDLAEYPIEIHRKYRKKYYSVNYTINEKHQLLVDLIFGETI